MQKSEQKGPSCSQQHVEVTQKDLPLSCPMLGQSLWNAHPRVFLPVAEAGRVVCPYCSTEYVLVDA